MDNNELSVSSIKESAREQAKAVRQKIHGISDASTSIDLSKHILAQVKSISADRHIIASFWPLGSEIDVRIAMSDLSRLGHTLCLPVIEQKHQPLVFRQYETGDELHTGAFKTKEPSADAPKIVPDILLVPLLAFDNDGHRLGYGGGYYDRTISNIKQQNSLVTIGIGFSGQKVRSVPNAEHDIRLDYIVTEQGLLGGKKLK